jgi:hypothetical protein
LGEEGAQEGEFGISDGAADGRWSCKKEIEEAIGLFRENYEINWGFKSTLVSKTPIIGKQL